jgi:2-polyprenyl-3-methyl-5-hydroxy-6-metoxy-1,4-benzoquinol methylase
MNDKYQDYPCDLCGADDTVEVPYARLYTNDQPVDICKGCGFVYVKSRRSAKDIAKEWSEKLYKNSYTARIPAVKARQTYVSEYIDVEVGLKDKLVLDIGAGEGQFLQIIQEEYAAKVYGIEPSVQNCEGLRDLGIDCFEGTIEDALAADLSVSADIVTIMWTLENCRSCRDMLKGVHRYLKDDGVLVISTGSRILVPFKKTMQNYLGVGSKPVDTHAFRFSANTLRGMLAVSGFEVISINRYVDTDYLCVIARKAPEGEEVKWEGDNFMKVHHFFERWHQDSLFYL